MMEQQMIEQAEVTAKVTKEEKEQLKQIAREKKIVQYLVDQYLQSQAYRIKAENQIRALTQGYDKYDLTQFVFISKEKHNAAVQEALNKKYMDIVTDEVPVCRWMKSITGIGPVISAYLFASFQMAKDRYNTDFLSYAGLNDNNNPWLGTKRAQELTDEAIGFREQEFSKISDFIIDQIGETKFKKLNTQFKKLGKNDFSFEDVEKTVFSTLKENIELPEFDKMSDYIKWIASPKRCDDILIAYVSEKTGRKFKNVKTGTRNNWETKNSKAKEPTTDDLSSYLAKPPYNTELKKYLFIIGDMFVKNSGREKSLYGKIYKQRRLEETLKNENGEYADQAKKILASKNFDTKTTAYKALSQGKLPDAHIAMRARRYAVKLFISHVFEAMYYDEFRIDPPQTYVIQFMGHHDYIAPEVDYRPYIDGLK